VTLALVGSEHARAFAPRLIEVASLNARVSDAIVEQINRVRKAGALAPSSSLLVLGPAGAGKTHLFERMRRKVGAGATFVHVRPEIGVEESLEHVLLTVVDALKQPVANQSYAQLEVVVGSALALANGDSPRFPSAFLEKARGMSAGERDDLVQRALDQFEREDARLDASWLELFLSVPFVDGAKKRAALAWLSGREPSELELRRLGLTEGLTSGRAVTALRALATVAAHAAPLVVVFDQLENLVEADGRAYRIHAHARVFSELHDEVSRMVLVQMALDGEWTLRIGPQLAPSERSRLEARVLHVELPTPDERDELLLRWLEQVAPEQRGGAFPWPFTGADWQRLRSQPGATPRMLLVALRKAAEGEPPFASAAAPSSPADEETDDALARHWEDALREAHAELEQAAAENRGIDEARLAAAMRVLLLATGCVKVDLAARRAGRETLRFVREGIKESSVFVVQSRNGRSVATALGHARKTSESQGVIVVREQALALPPTWKTANEHLDALQRTSSARVVAVGRPELARALALHDLLSDARSQDLAGPDGQPLPEAAVRSWVQRCLDPSGFSLALGKAVLDEAAEASAPAAAAPSLPARASERPGRAGETQASAARAARSLARAVLVELRLASVERVVAEARRREPNASRARVLAELRADPAVRWFGRTVVHLQPEAP
jgi:hypothetical protein